MTIGDDLTGKLLLKGAEETHLRVISRKIFHQIHIYEEDLEVIEWFEFEKGYKYRIPLHSLTLYLLIIRYEILHLSSTWAFCCISSWSWKKLEEEFLSWGIESIMFPSNRAHTTTPKSLRTKLAATMSMAEKK